MRVIGDSRFVDVDGPVHVIDHGGAADGPVVLCVHGLGSSSAAWGGLARALGPAYRVLAVDLPGHGRTPSSGRSMAVDGAAELLLKVIDQLALGPVVLVGHSMGAAVSALAAAGAPERVDRLVLLAPPLPRSGLPGFSKHLIPHVALCLWPRLGLLALRRRVARQTLEEYVVEGLRLTCASVADLAELAEVLAAELQAAYDDGEDPLASFIHAARSVGLLVAGGRRYRELLGTLAPPVQVVHGARDRVLSPDGLGQLDQLQPEWETLVLPDVGHSPHLEAPDRVAALLRRDLPAVRPGRSGRTAARGKTAAGDRPLTRPA